MTINSQGGFGTIGVLLGLAAIVIIGGIALTSSSPATEAPGEELPPVMVDETSSDDDNSDNMMEDEKMSDTGEMMVDEEKMEDSMMEGEGEMMDEDTETSASADTPAQELPSPEPTKLTAGIFTKYNPDLLANAENGDVVIFFHAEWCPSCKTLEKDIQSKLDAIPEGVTILKVDYDTATELKKKYSVVRQHTLVKVDANGDEIKKLTGLTITLSQVTSQL